MSSVRGLERFLAVAQLSAHLGQAQAFCEEWGAVSIQEVLDDEEICQALIGHLQLRKLEQRRFEVAASEVSWAEEEAPEVTTVVQPVSSVPAAVQAARGFGKGGGSGKGGSGKGGRRPAAASYGQSCTEPSPGPETPAVNPFFGRDEPEESASSSTSHYFAAEQPPLSRNHRSSSHYFDAGDPPRADVRKSPHYFDVEEPAPRKGGQRYGESAVPRGTSGRASSHYFSAEEPADCREEPRGGYVAPSSRTSEPVWDKHVVERGGRPDAAGGVGQFCIECGNRLSAAAKFCSICGTKKEDAQAERGKASGGGVPNPRQASEPVRQAHAAESLGVRRPKANTNHYFAEEEEAPAPERHREAAARQQPERRRESAAPQQAKAPSALLPPLRRGTWRAVRTAEWRCKIPAEDRMDVIFRVDEHGNGELEVPIAEKKLVMFYRRTGEQMMSDGPKHTFNVEGAQKGSAKAHILSTGELWIRFDYTRTIGNYIFAVEEEVKRPNNSVPEDVQVRPSVLDELQRKQRDKQDEFASKREAARQRRRQGDAADRSGGHAGGEERRYDPDDGQMYTYDDFFQKHRRNFTDAEIQEYWLSDCTVVRETAPSQSFYSTAGRRGGDDGAPRKRDPDDGKFYSYEELQRKYTGKFTEPRIKKYWQFECRDS
mmetsp:Transcript_76799/g.140376  ORF Transcript_76799/g.140376 Transcript_76799/m.140376 type:complete len:657 (+) Transcript_76799:27-1997(+)